MVRRVPYSTDLSVTAQEAVDGTVYYDGEQWFTLLSRVDRGFSSRVIPRGRADGLYGLGELTRAEAEVFGRALEARGPVIVSVLTEARDRTRQGERSGRLSKHRSSRSERNPDGCNPDPLESCCCARLGGSWRPAAKPLAATP